MKKMSFMLSLKRNTFDKSRNLKSPKQPTTSLCISSKIKTLASSTQYTKEESYKSPDKPSTSTSDLSLMYHSLYFRKNHSLHLTTKMNPPTNNTIRHFFNFTPQTSSYSKNTRTTRSVNSRTLPFSRALLFIRMSSMRISLQVFLLLTLRIG
jgi:hypothetical protein